MHDLSTQLRDYYDSQLSLIDPEDVITHRVPTVAHRPTARGWATRQPGWVVAAAVAVVVLVTAFGVAWVLRLGSASTDVVIVPAGPFPDRVIFHGVVVDESLPAPSGVVTESYELFSVHPDTMELSRLTDTAIDERAAVWAPDGSGIAYHTDDPDNVDGTIIYVMDPDGTNVRRIADGKFPMWSPDGTELAYEKVTEEGSSIWIIGADGSNDRRVTDLAGFHGAPAWAPDGNRLVFGGDPDAGIDDCTFDAPAGTCNYDIYLIDIDGSGMTRLTDHEAQDGFPEWSPTGTSIVFHSNRGGNWDIYTIDPAGTTLTNLTNHPALDGHASWSPDGTRIVFNSNRNGANLVYVMDAAGANLSLLTPLPGGSEANWPDW